MYLINYFTELYNIFNNDNFNHGFAFSNFDRGKRTLYDIVMLGN